MLACLNVYGVIMRFNYVKIGTIPFGPALIKSKRKMPKEGDIVYIRLDNGKSIYSSPWIRVKVDNINENCTKVYRLSKYEV